MAKRHRNSPWSSIHSAFSTSTLPFLSTPLTSCLPITLCHLSQFSSHTFFLQFIFLPLYYIAKPYQRLWITKLITLVPFLCCYIHIKTYSYPHNFLHTILTHLMLHSLRSFPLHRFMTAVLQITLTSMIKMTELGGKCYFSYSSLPLSLHYSPLYLSTVYISSVCHSLLHP